VFCTAGCSALIRLTVNGAATVRRSRACSRAVHQDEGRGGTRSVGRSWRGMARCGRVGAEPRIRQQVPLIGVAGDQPRRAAVGQPHQSDFS
ncbi:hypothetical protein LH612_28340, partial [Klebsiella pneumoniae]|nr:hypothetical protein [Klebsiella pneumoniae]